jgi:hypothetical protein
MKSSPTTGFRSGSYDRSASKIRLRIPAAAAALALLGFPVGQSIASDGSASREVADGRPWQMRTEDGRVTTLVLYANGTGKFTGGPMNLSPKWRATSDGLCLKPAALVKERCVVLSPTGNGFVGTRDGATVFTLER